MSIESMKQVIEDKLPPLPTPEFTETVRSVPCITVTEHEHLMRTYALQAIAHATQLAEVTDEKIESCALEAGFRVESTGSIWAVDGYVGTRVDPGLRKFAKAILAPRPVQVPMTDEQVKALVDKTAYDEATPEARTDFINGIRWGEYFHGITAQPKKETP